MTSKYMPGMVYLSKEDHVFRRHVPKVFAKTASSI